MPRKNETKVSEKTVAKIVQRYMTGRESADSLAKEYRVSRATLYNWITQARERVVKAAAKANMSEASVERSDRMTLAAEITQLRLENDRLKKKLFEVLLTHNLL
jgi:transposase-like protein